MRKLEARDRLTCILDSGTEDDQHVKDRLVTAIRARLRADEKPVAFSLAVDATKVSQILEVSSGYKAIVGEE